MIKWERGIFMTITKTYSKSQIEQLYTSLKSGTICKTPPYALFQIRMSDCVITAYESLKVVFQGTAADFYSDIIEAEPTMTTPSPTPVHYPQAGSDEVGTGDYFGPVVVCAAYVNASQLPLLSTLHIQDSKQIKDVDILRMAPTLIATLTYSVLILDNTKYNQVQPTNNMNQIKAKMHNQAFINLQKKLSQPLETIYVDQFTPPKNYFQYIKQEKTIISNIHFETKAENKFISVACAAIIARYFFLTTLDKMAETYNFTFPKGAGAHVDEAGKAFVEQYGAAALYNVSKYHFANTKKILNPKD